MKKFFYGIYDFDSGDFDVRRSGELPVMIFDNEADREDWINSPNDIDIIWEKEFGWYRKAITAEQAREASSIQQTCMETFLTHQLKAAIPT